MLARHAICKTIKTCSHFVKLVEIFIKLNIYLSCISKNSLGTWNQDMSIRNLASQCAQQCYLFQPQPGKKSQCSSAGHLTDRLLFHHTMKYLSSSKGDNHRCIPKAYGKQKKAESSTLCVPFTWGSRRDILDPQGEKSGLWLPLGVEIDWKKLCAGQCFFR